MFHPIYMIHSFFFFFLFCSIPPFVNITVTFKGFLLSGRFRSFLIPYGLRHVLVVELRAAIIPRLRDITESDVLIFDICKGYKTQTDSLKKSKKKTKKKKKRSAY